jgi:endoglucanase
LPVFATNQIDINKIKNELGKGVNISLLEQYAAVDGELIKKLQQIYYRCSQLNIKLIIVYHYGKLSNENIYSENDRIIRIWKQIITAMKANSTNNLFFELYNEPTTDMDVWKSSVTTLVRELRKEDPERIFIIGGANYNGFNELLHMGKLDVDDGKIIYTFHFYEPYIFTHQGADWTAEKTFITGFPYPYKAKKMPRLYNAPSDSQLYKDYFRIPKESTCEYLFERIKYISNEAKSLIYRLSAQKRG